MKQPRLRIAVIALSFATLTAGAQQNQPKRPAVTGIAHLAVYSSDPAATERFYTDVLGAAKAPDPENPAGILYRFSESQAVEVLPLPAKHSLSRMDHVAYATADAPAMRRYLAAHGVKEITELEHDTNGDQWFYARDPEGNRVEFLEQAGPPSYAAVPRAASDHIIHTGFLVRDRAAEDPFYRGLLGFRPYWYGGQNAGKVDWVSQQVPDGHDWLEYMMANANSDTPDAGKVDARQFGVMNHFSLGVPNMEAALTRLALADASRDRKLQLDGPRIGRGGKWQANLFDPDGTRVELMEFQPVIKPCCSEYTAESPTK